MPRDLARRLLIALGLVAGGLLSWSAGATSASGPAACGHLPSGTTVYVACTVPQAAAPYTTYAGGQGLNLAMGANSVFAAKAGTGIVAIQCEYDNGTGTPGDPPDANYCDAQTAAGDFPYATHADGSFDYVADHPGDSVTVYALPSSGLGHPTITCDATHACVWYVGPNYNDFKTPHVFSNPYYVSPGSGTTPAGTTAAPPESNASAGAASGVSISTGTTGSSGAGSSGELAYTGAGPTVLELAGVGALMVAAGAIGRRRLVPATAARTPDGHGGGHT